MVGELVSLCVLPHHHHLGEPSSTAWANSPWSKQQAGSAFRLLVAAHPPVLGSRQRLGICQQFRPIHHHGLRWQAGHYCQRDPQHLPLFRLACLPSPGTALPLCFPPPHPVLTHHNGTRLPDWWRTFVLLDTWASISFCFVSGAGHWTFSLFSSSYYLSFFLEPLARSTFFPMAIVIGAGPQFLSLKLAIYIHSIPLPYPRKGWKIIPML